MKAGRDMTLDALKGGLMILIILGHMLEYNLGSILNHIAFNYIYLFHVPLFVLISGYFSKREPWKVFVWKTVSLAETYIAVQVLLLLTAFLFQGRWLRMTDLIIPNAAAWYILSLLFWRFFLRLLPETVLEKHLLIGFALLVSLLSGFIPIEKAFSFQRTLAFLPFFLVGYKMKQSGRMYGYVPTKWLAVVILVFPLVALTIIGKRNISSVVYGLYTYYDKAFHPVVMMVFRGCFLLLSFLMGRSLIAVMPKVKKEGIITGIGTFSLLYYSYHLVFQRMLIIPVRHFHLPLNFPAMLFYVFIVIGIIMLLCRMTWFRKSLNPISSVLAGMR